MLKIDIVPIVIEKTQTINRFETSIAEYVLNEYAVVMIDCYFDDTYIVGVNYRLPNDVFDNWGEDDEYINLYVAENLKQILEQNEK